MQQRLSGLVRTLLKIGFTLGLLAVLLARADLAAVGEKISAIGFGTATVCVLIIVALSFLVALRWHLILIAMQSSLHLSECWRLVMIGLFFNQTLPSGIGGDAVRVWLMVRQGERLRTSLLSVATDRIFALAAVLACLIVALLLVDNTPVLLLILSLSAAGVGCFLVLFSFNVALEWMVRRWPQLASARARAPASLLRVLGLARDLSRTVWAVSSHWTAGPPVLLLSIINQIVLGLIIYLIARALGSTIGLVDTLILFPPAMLLSMVPVSFGGWGVREAAIVWLFGSVGVPPETALGISILFGLITTAAGLPGGLLWLVVWLRPASQVLPKAISE
jgi:uncharacterized protein (TIRG00374 family)